MSRGLGDVYKRQVLYESPENMQQVVITALPCMVFFLIIIAGAVVGTAQLLDKKVSL